MLILFLCQGFWQNLQAEESVDKIEQQLKQKQSALHQMKEDLSINKNQAFQYQAQLANIDKEIQLKSLALEKIQKAIFEKEEKLKELELTQKKISQHLEKQQHFLARQLKMLYALKQTNEIKMVLNLENPQELYRLMNYYPYLKTAYIDAIKTSTSDLQILAKNKEILNQEKVVLAQLITKQANHLSEIKALQQEQFVLLKNIQNQVVFDEKQLQLTQIEEKHLSERLAILDKTLGQLPPPNPAWRSFSSSKGRLNYPLQANGIDAIKAALPSTSKGNPVIIKVAPGQEVLSIYYGRVVFAETLRGFGLLMIIDHGGGYMSLYGHNKELYKKVGDSVRAGQLIARVANTSELGNSRLYFEIRKNGKPINLVGWFK